MPSDLYICVEHILQNLTRLIKNSKVNDRGGMYIKTMLFSQRFRALQDEKINKVNATYTLQLFTLIQEMGKQSAEMPVEGKKHWVTC